MKSIDIVMQKYVIVLSSNMAYVVGVYCVCVHLYKVFFGELGVKVVPELFYSGKPLKQIRCKPHL